MEHRITASLLARRLADILGRVRYGGDTFLVERHNVPIARITPAGGKPRTIFADAARVWMGARPPDPSFADDLERVGAADRAPRNPWALS
jgi:antitoxin (DNA-binding transcriptional repressor) of toxin-antitoxin stability system